MLYFRAFARFEVLRPETGRTISRRAIICPAEAETQAIARMDKEQAVYQAFSPAPLNRHQLNLYVRLDEARGNEDVVHRLAQRIRLTGTPVSQVLAGHKGSGKSTELARLQNELERADASQRYFVVFCSADDDIDRNDVDFPEVLIAMMRQLAKQVFERENIPLKPGYFKDRWERLKGSLGSEVSFEKLDLAAGMAKVSATIKNSPDARSEVRRALEPDTSNWIDAANEVIGEAELALRKLGYAGLVILVDDLDKMIIRPVDHVECSTAEYLFIHRAAQLTAFKCHTVYTLPLSLAYSHHELAIKNSFGGTPPLVPMIKLSTRPPESKVYTAGIRKMQNIIELRLSQSGMDRDGLFKSNSIETQLIKLSGGQPSELMSLVREAIISAGFPIDSDALQRVRKVGEREYARVLRHEHWPIIEEVRKTGRYDRATETEDAFRDLIESRAILQYVNDVEWYGLNPMVANLTPPSASNRPKKK